MAQTSLWNIAKKRTLEDRGLIREYKAMHEENFLSSWWREDVEGKAEVMEKMSNETKEEEKKRGKRDFEGEKGRVPVICKRACYEFQSGMNWEGKVEDLSEDWSEPWCGVSVCMLASVPVVTDPLSPANAVCDVVVSDSDCDFVKPQTCFSLSLLKTRSECSFGV